MIYKSVKDPTVTAVVIEEDTKCKTTTLQYQSGGEDKQDKSFVISNSTLKRWWRKVSDTDFTAEELKQIDTPYKPEVTPHYIPKPESVVEYEEKKRRVRRNNDIPEYEAICETFGPICDKFNDRSSYIKFKTGTTLWRKQNCIDIYAVESDWMTLTEAGLKSAPNKDKVRPYAIKVTTQDEYDRVVGALIKEG